MNMNEKTAAGWFAVRCVVMWGDGAVSEAEGDHCYEERLTLWHAASIDEAIELASREAQEYSEAGGHLTLGLSQAFEMFDEPDSGVEIFSLLRVSTSDPDDYLDHFFDTGHEQQRHG
jgi:hypothetical protein